MLTTTLKDLRGNKACVKGYNRLVCSLSGEAFDPSRQTYIRYKHNDLIPLTYILESNGLHDALWALRASTASDRDMRHYAVWCAKQVQHLMTDQRSMTSLDVAEKYADGLATDDELEDARAAAVAAALAAGATARAAWAAWDAAWDVASGAARAAAMVACDAACDAARASADAAYDAARAAQKDMFILMCNGSAPWQKESKKWLLI